MIQEERLSRLRGNIHRGTVLPKRYVTLQIVMNGGSFHLPYSSVGYAGSVDARFDKQKCCFYGSMLVTEYILDSRVPVVVISGRAKSEMNTI